MAAGAAQRRHHHGRRRYRLRDDPQLCNVFSAFRHLQRGQRPLMDPPLPARLLRLPLLDPRDQALVEPDQALPALPVHPVLLVLLVHPAGGPQGPASDDTRVVTVANLHGFELRPNGDNTPEFGGPTPTATAP